MVGDLETIMGNNAPPDPSVEAILSVIEASI